AGGGLVGAVGPRWRSTGGGVGRGAGGLSALGVRLAPAGPDAVSLAMADADGEPVAAVRSLMLRPVSAGQLTTPGARAEPLFCLGWTKLPEPAPAPDLVADGPTVVGVDSLGATGTHAASIAAIASGAPVPDLVFAHVAPAWGWTDDVVSAVREVTSRVLSLIQEWLTEERLAGSRLVVVTRGAMALGAGETPDLVTAPVWGLMRSAQLEHPGRF